MERNHETSFWPTLSHQCSASPSRGDNDPDYSPVRVNNLFLCQLTTETAGQLASKLALIRLSLR
eukprot:1142673-Pelagomonas_calceolata.AAC.1